MHEIVMEKTLLIMEKHGKIIESCFLISVGNLYFARRVSNKSKNTLRVEINQFCDG